MPRLPLAGLLIALACSATANDLQQVLPANTAADIRQQLQANRHAHFAVVDYARHSSQPRLMLFERNSLRLLASYRVAHGQGSDLDHDGFTDHYSDAPGSHASSLGTLRTDQVYQSSAPGHGLSIRLIGLSPGNANAERRAIVLHAKSYMEDDFIRRHGVAGRSHGCLVLAGTDRDKAIALLRGGALIFVIDSRLSAHHYLARNR